MLNVHTGPKGCHSQEKSNACILEGRQVAPIYPSERHPQNPEASAGKGILQTALQQSGNKIGCTVTASYTVR